MKPYTEETLSDNKVIRKFSSKSDDHEFRWHRDDENRFIRIIKSNGWFFQFDNEIPFEMKEDGFFSIKKGQWHRIIKGYDDLILSIIKE